jgi:HEAT repeat protein
LKAPDSARIEAAVEVLKEKDRARSAKAVGDLARRKPDPKLQPGVARALEALIPVLTGHERDELLRALKVWADRDSVGPLVKVLDDKGISARTSRHTAMEILGRFPDPRGAEAVARRLGDNLDRFAAQRALQAMGPAAEDAVKSLLSSPEVQTKTEACRILRLIGTRKSLPLLQVLTTDKNFFLASSAKSAIREINKREK